MTTEYADAVDEAFFYATDEQKLQLSVTLNAWLAEVAQAGEQAFNSGSSGHIGVFKLRASISDNGVSFYVERSRKRCEQPLSAVQGSPVLVYRDLVQALHGCTSAHCVQGPTRRRAPRRVRHLRRACSRARHQRAQVQEVSAPPGPRPGSVNQNGAPPVCYISGEMNVQEKKRRGRAAAVGGATDRATTRKSLFRAWDACVGYRLQ